MPTPQLVRLNADGRGRPRRAAPAGPPPTTTASYSIASRVMRDQFRGSGSFHSGGLTDTLAFEEGDADIEVLHRLILRKANVQWDGGGRVRQTRLYGRCSRAQRIALA
jgi:hypothetical protein